MRSRPQLKKDIFFHLPALADTMMDIIGDDSIAGRGKLIAIIKEAKSEYVKRINNAVEGWLYQHTRLRSMEVDVCIEHIENARTVIDQCNAFSVLINNGKWNIESFNTHLFFAFIKTIDAYQPLSNTLMQSEINPRLLTLLLSRIKSFERTYHHNVQKQSESLKELEAIQKAKVNTKEAVVVLDSLPEALQCAHANADQSVFHLAIQTKGWQLFFIDPCGKKHLLHIDNELASLLKNVEYFAKCSMQKQQKIQNQCLKSRDFLLEKTKICVNPPASLTDFNAMYVLNFTQEKKELFWYDNFGNKKPIDLSKYPALSHWLTSVTDWTEKSDKLLKIYLQGVDTRNALVGNEDFKLKLAKCLGHEVAPSQKALAPKTGRLDLKQFSKIEGLFAKKTPLPMPGHIHVEEFGNVAALFNQ